tara:strand:+ start:135 stop:713 length:579 start_codon:yes stop_codon:yes gene_type:complete
MGTIFVDNLEPQSGTSLTLGASGDTVNLGSGGTVTNTPCFLAYLGSNQDSIPHETATKVQFDTVSYQTGSTFDTSNNRWTPAVAGKYWIFCSLSIKATDTSQYYNLRKAQAQLYKNGSVTANPEIRMRMDANDANIQAATFNDFTVTLQGAITLNTTDYLEVYGFGGNANGTNDRRFEGSVSYFGGYRIIGI